MIHGVKKVLLQLQLHVTRWAVFAHSSLQNIHSIMKNNFQLLTLNLNKIHLGFWLQYKKKCRKKSSCMKAFA